MASGVAVHKNVEGLIESVKGRKVGIALFRINEGLSEIIVDTDFPSHKSGEDVLKKLREVLPKDQPRYAVVDFCYHNEEGHARDAMLFVSWSPDTSPIKLKMLYASSKQYIARFTDGAKAIQATDYDDLDFKEIRQKCQKL